MGSLYSRDKDSGFVRRGIVSYANHKLEFLGFFETHKNLCDKLSGLKSVQVVNGDVKLFIERSNFLMALNHVNSFIIKYRYGIKEEAKKRDVMDRFYSLQNDFLADEVYSEFCRKDVEGKLNVGQLVVFNKLYLSYLIRCFDLVSLMAKYLEGNLNITNLDFLKSLDYLDYEGFYRNLDVYRDEVANSLSMLSFDNLIDCFKRVLGFVYTYRGLLSADTVVKVDFLLDRILVVLSGEEYVRSLVRFKEGVLRVGRRGELVKGFVALRDWFNIIVDLCHEDFSSKRVLPKIERRVFVDESLI